MKWPFTTRALLEEKQRQIDELRAELAAAKQDNRDLLNQIVWRHSNIALDPDRLPEAYRPKISVLAGAPPMPASSTDKPTPVMGTGANRARATINRLNRENELEFARRSGTPIAIETPAERADKAAIIADLNKAADEGQQAAKSA